MPEITFDKFEFRERVLRKIYEMTEGSLSKSISSIEEIQKQFSDEESKHVFDAVDFLIFEEFLNGVKKRYISDSVNISLIHLTSKGVKHCEGVREESKILQHIQHIQITGNYESNIAVGNKNIQTIQNVNTQLEQLLQLIEYMKKELPDNKELDEIKVLISQQKTEGAPSKSFLKAIGQAVKQIAISAGGVIMNTVIQSTVLSKLGL